MTLPPSGPFLKWAGGKRKVVSALLPHLPPSFRTYHEPFVGGGALFFALAAPRLRPFQHAILSDANLRLVRTWQAVRDDVESVIARLEVHASSHSRDHFLAVRKSAPDGSPDPADVAAWLIYLNKTAFNGLYRVNRRGVFNVPFGRYANPTICNSGLLQAVSRTLDGVEVRHAPFEATLDLAEAGDVVYFDPPYVPRSATSSFTSYTEGCFGPEDQVRLRDVALALADRGVRVVLSNHDTPGVRDLYRPPFSLFRVEVARFINSQGDRRGTVPELVIVAG
ncbi:MAG: Dam family site-specific DNA-(adenine-N6)-methyltransferase [Deltaproteobacteria bacterium]|nr:Dam family site-specific DNA-(adenine-N6)-methyltransferase [Deltaproteobacteria bacterium]